MNTQFILTFLIALIVMYIILKILSLPFKIIVKLLINGFVGGVVIWIINLIGANFGFMITLNWISALIAGILGIPGVVILVILHFIL